MVEEVTAGNVKDSKYLFPNMLLKSCYIFLLTSFRDSVSCFCDCDLQCVKIKVFCNSLFLFRYNVSLF